MFSINFSRRIVALTLAVGAAAVVTTSAPAKYDGSRPQGYLGVTQQNATGGVTPTDLARAVPRESNAPAGVTPTDLARSVPSTDISAAKLESAKSDPFWSSTDRNLAVGFGLGLALVIALSLAFAVSRSRNRIAYS